MSMTSMYNSFLRRHLVIEALKFFGHPPHLTRKVVRARKKRGKMGWELTRKAKELPPLLSLLAPVPQTSTGLPLIKLVGTGEGAVADLTAQRARAGREQSWREREALPGSHGEDSSMYLLIGQRVGWAFIPSSFLFLLIFSIFFSPGWHV
jgi:hypothetical protein